MHTSPLHTPRPRANISLRPHICSYLSLPLRPSSHLRLTLALSSSSLPPPCLPYDHSMTRLPHTNVLHHHSPFFLQHCILQTPSPPLVYLYCIAMFLAHRQQDEQWLLAQSVTCNLTVLPFISLSAATACPPTFQHSPRHLSVHSIIHTGYTPQISEMPTICVTVHTGTLGYKHHVLIMSFTTSSSLTNTVSRAYNNVIPFHHLAHLSIYLARDFIHLGNNQPEGRDTSSSLSLRPKPSTPLASPNKRRASQTFPCWHQLPLMLFIVNILHQIFRHLNTKHFPSLKMLNIVFSNI